MKRWSENFLKSVCQPALIEDVEDLTPTCIGFDAKLKRLKANVILSNFIDRDEFEDIVWDDMVGRSTEHRFLRKIQQGLDTMASTPMGKDILSNLYSSTYFGVAPMEQAGRFFDRSCPMVFLRAEEDVFKNQTLVLKILVHECTHAKNVEMENKVNACLLPPCLSFMKYMINELSAYLSENIVLKQMKTPKISDEQPTLDYVMDLCERLTDNKYVDEFADRVIEWHKQDILKPQTATFSDQNLKVFSYYFKTYPVLCNLAIIDRLYQMYQGHVVRKARHQMKRTETRHTR